MKQKSQFGRERRVQGMVAAGLLLAGVPLMAQTTSAKPNFTLPAGGFNSYQIPALPAAKPITANGTVVEDVIARVNDQVITRTEVQRAEEGLIQEAKQDHWTDADLADKQHTLLRDMIDQDLLLSKGKELGITGDAEVLRQLDEIRKRANLPDMESLEKAAAEQGVSFEDFKKNIRNQVITQQVVRDEVGRRLNMTHAQEQAYYDAHKSQFEQPEQVHLSEILVPTPDNATEAQVTAAQAKADGLEAKLKAGGDFTALAKSASGGPTASAGGDLGDFKRGMLGDVLEKATFPLPVGGYTEPIRTRQGFVILKVDSHQQAGVPPLAQVENQVQEGLYMTQLQPALRKYLSQARQDAYVEIKPGFQDAGSGGADGRMAFTSYAPPPLKKKVVKKQRAEQAKAEKAEEHLVAAREKVAEKQAAKDASAGGVRNASAVRRKKKVKREKVRFGQAPRNALPNGTAETTAVVPSLGSASPADQAMQGAAPGSALAAGTDGTTISTGTGAEETNPLEAQNDQPEHKTRFGSRQSESEEKRAQKELAKAEVKTTKRPQKATQEETAEEKVQSAPLGLKSDTEKPKKAKHIKRAKDQPKERLQEKVKPAAPAAGATPVDATVNPSLGAAPTNNSTQPVSGTSDQTTLPPATATPPGALPAGQPIPAVTGTQANPPTTTVPQPQ